MLFQSKSRGGLRAVGSVLTKRGDWIGSGGVFAHNDDDESPDPTPSPIHSLDLTAAPSASNSFDGYGLATSRTVTDYNGRIVEIPANAVPMGGLRPVRNICHASQDLTDASWVLAGGVKDDASHVSFSAFWQLIKKNAVITTAGTYIVSFDLQRVSGTSGVKFHSYGSVEGSYQTFSTAPDETRRRYAFVVTYAGTNINIGIASAELHVDATQWLFTNIQIQDITHRADLSTAPDEYVSSDDDYGTGVNGFRYFDTELANTVASNVVTEGTGASIEGWGDWQPDDTNYADCTHDFSGGADTITLTATGSYTLWVEGTAQVSIAAGTATITGAGAATDGSSVTINCTATGTITLTLDSGTLDEWGAYQIIQLNDGTVPTAFIPSTGSASRPAMSPAPTISGLTGTEDARLTVKGLAADLVTPDPTDTTERTLDVDNTDGEFDTLPSPIKVLSIDVYNDGERPA